MRYCRVSWHLYQLLPGGPQLFSGRDLLKKRYPAALPNQMAERFYLVYSIAEVKEPEFQGRIWDVSCLPGVKAVSRHCRLR